jgi:hypothetical protein
MNAVGGTDVNTKKIFDARVGDHISHDEVFLNLNWSLATSPECEGNGESRAAAVMGERRPLAVGHAGL